MKELRIIQIDDLYGIQIKTWLGWKVLKLNNQSFSKSSLRKAIQHPILYFVDDLGLCKRLYERADAVFNKNYKIIKE